jgi:hypothetical protein
MAKQQGSSSGQTMAKQGQKPDQGLEGRYQQDQVPDRRHPVSGVCLDRVPIRPNVRASAAARLAREPGLDVRQPSTVWPTVAADRGPVRALVIRAIDQETANASGAHFCEGDLLADRFGHGLLKRGAKVRAIAPNITERLQARCVSSIADCL